MSARGCSGGRTTIVSHSLMPIVSGTSLTTDVTAELVPNGVDLVVTFTNETGSPLPVGSMAIPGIRLEPIVEEYRPVGYRGTLQTIPIDMTQQEPLGNANSDWNYFGPHYLYPGDLFSPLFTLADSQVALGLGVVYDVLAYDDYVKIHLEKPGGQYMYGHGIATIVLAELYGQDPSRDRGVIRR